MKGSHFLILAFFLSTLPLLGEPYSEIMPSKRSELPRVLFEFRAGYFYPTSHPFRKHFKESVDWQATLAIPLYYGEYRWFQGLNAWAAYDDYAKHGRSFDNRHSARMQINPLTLGLKYYFPSFFCRAPIHFYIAGGMKYFFVHTFHYYPSVQKKINLDGLGGVIEGGFMMVFWDHLLFDLFSAYSFKSFGTPQALLPMKLHLNVSNITTGLGIGYKF